MTQRNDGGALDWHSSSRRVRGLGMLAKMQQDLVGPMWKVEKPKTKGSVVGGGPLLREWGLRLRVQEFSFGNVKREMPLRRPRVDVT